MQDKLNAKILAAHAQDDKAALVDLYRHAADALLDVDQRCFYLTHAYIFALETNHPACDDLFSALRKYRRV